MNVWAENSPGRARAGFIVGPTGAGKTAVAIAVAERLGAEIVNADSRQIYRGMDLGTAKPSAADRARVRHHLIDVCDPRRPIDVAEFARIATAALNAIAARGRPAIVVGGSGLYLRALRGGIFPGPPAAPKIRAALAAEAAAHGTSPLHARLAAIDPASAARIAPNDLRRVIRALEVWEVSGVALSEHQGRHRFGGGVGAGLILGLTRERARLCEIIDRRFDAMLAAGLVDEVRGLLAAGVSAGGPPLETIGYREIAAYLGGQCTLAEAADRARRASRQLAKRQMTWFRREPGVQWLDPERAIDQAGARFAEFFAAERAQLNG
ncbi:MAG TPA: tRNA (adenosine(37)-N6)-dimethylallyltransferase MiaA [Candidatus Binataceae bacterium]|nr:tRNA (adenosine(37)-N6)-dimethylallyltransferase MiaA [Candidatus Binataceae bacterium]